MAALEGKSIKQYALERLFPSDEQQAMQDLNALLQSRMDAAEEGGAVCTFVSFPGAAWEREKRYFTTSISWISCLSSSLTSCAKSTPLERARSCR